MRRHEVLPGLTEDGVTKGCAVEQHDRQRHDQRQEVFVVVRSNTIGKPNAVVVMSGDTCFAVTAVLAASRFKKLTRTASVSWVEDYSIIWIFFHLLCMIFRCDVRFRHDTEIEEDIWSYCQDGDAESVDSRDSWPCTGDECTLPDH